MRFKEFKITEGAWEDAVGQTFADFGGINKPSAKSDAPSDSSSSSTDSSSGGPVVVIGDSIAVGIAGAGHADGKYAVGGSSTTKVLGLVQDCIKDGKAKGATVILSSGAANSSKVITADGKQIQNENFGPISTQIQALKKVGATVVLVGVASEKTPPQKPTQYTNGQKWVADYTGVNQQLESIASSNGAKFLGPLEKFDNTISQHDGIHPYNGYSKLFQAGSQFAGPVSGGKAGKGVAATGNAKDAVKFFMSKGWSAEQAAGIVGNLQAESGANLQTNLVGDGGQAYGLAQWHPDRQAKFKRAFGKDIRQAGFQEQLAFVQWEFEHDESAAAAQIKNTKTAKDAAAAMDKHYERSKGTARTQRIANANNLVGTATA